MSKGLPILIVGGGIGGVTLAIALSRKGISSIVLERANDFREIGGGIQFCPNVFKMFDHLKIKDKILQIAFFPENLVYMDGVDGTEYARIPLGQSIESRFHYPYAVFYRAELLNLLLKECRKSDLIQLVPAARIIDVEEKADSIIAISEQKNRYEGTLIVGADGLWSTMRKFVLGANIPRTTKSCVWRGLVPIKDLDPALCPNDVVHWHRPSSHLVHYPISPSGLFNIVAEIESKKDYAPLATDGDFAEVDEMFADAPEPVLKLLKHLDRKYMRVLSDLSPDPRWFKGRIVLLGDAAHSTLPHLTQGAGMAIEDSVVLAEELAKHGDDFQSAFMEYVQKRFMRTTYVQTLSRAYVDVHHAEGTARILRNYIFATANHELMYDIFGFLYKGIDI